jgi:hypothetical protein
MSQWPKLSETLAGRRSLVYCQSCGAAGSALRAWQEHDEADQPTPVAVMLCPACAERLIEPHPRLYRQLAAGEPFPGAMPCCHGCRHAVAMACRSPMLKANGGSGLPLKFPTPTQAIACGRGGKNGGCRHLTIWQGPVTCDGRESKESGA